MYTSAAIKNAPNLRNNRFKRHKLERPFAAAPVAGWLSRRATSRCPEFAAERQRRTTKPTNTRSSCALMWSGSMSYAAPTRQDHSAIAAAKAGSTGGAASASESSTRSIRRASAPRNSAPAKRRRAVIGGTEAVTAAPRVTVASVAHASEGGVSVSAGWRVETHYNLRLRSFEVRYTLYLIPVST